MDGSEASLRYDRLLANLVAAQKLLAQADDHLWADWMTAIRNELLRHDARGLDRLLDAYGGMGSFNDLVIHQMNGHRVLDTDIDPTNERLGVLRTALHKDASALRRDLSRES